MAREAGTVKCSVQPVAGTIAREHPAGAIRAVCRRRQAHDQHASTRVSEGWDRTPPIRLVAVCGSLFGGDLLAPCDESGAGAARADLGLNTVEIDNVPSWSGGEVVRCFGGGRKDFDRLVGGPTLAEVRIGDLLGVLYSATRHPYRVGPGGVGGDQDSVLQSLMCHSSR